MSIYYVTKAAGGSGVGSSGDPFTLAEAASTVVAGDKVWIKADSVYDVEDGTTNSILSIQTGGTIGNEIVWEGYKTIIEDGGIVQLDADPAGDQYTYCIFGAAGKNYNVIKNFECYGAASAGVDSGGADYWAIKMVSSHNNGSHGFNMDDYCRFEKCIAYNNSSMGIHADRVTHAIACVVYGNGGIGLASQGAIFINNLLYENTTDELNAIGLYYSQCAIGNTIDGNGTNVGFNYSTSSRQFIFNNIFFDCTTPIINTSTDVGEYALLGCNVYKNNDNDNSGTLLISAGNGIGNRGDVSEPTNLFTDEANDDYTLVNNSDAKNRALDANFTRELWADYAEGAGNNPPAE